MVHVKQSLEGCEGNGSCEISPGSRFQQSRRYSRFTQEILIMRIHGRTVDEDNSILECHTFYRRNEQSILAFVRHEDSMDPRCVILKVHEAFEGEQGTIVMREWAILARLEPVMPVKVAL